MDLSALHGERLGAAVVFVAATLVLALQLITPSPVVVSIGENTAQTRQIGQYFTYSDVSLIAVAASLLGASGTYLLIQDRSTTTIAEPEKRRPTPALNEQTAVESGPERARGDGNGRVTTRADEPQRRQEWEETLDRLRNNEKAVYQVVFDSEGELPQREIVQATDLSKATVSRTLDTLESKELIERKRRGMGNVVVLQ